MLPARLDWIDLTCIYIYAKHIVDDFDATSNLQSKTGRRIPLLAPPHEIGRSLCGV